MSVNVVFTLLGIELDGPQKLPVVGRFNQGGSDALVGEIGIEKVGLTTQLQRRMGIGV